MNQTMETTPTQTQPLTEQDKDRVIHNLIQSVEDLKKTVTQIQNDKVIESLQLPADVLEQIGVVQDTPARLPRGTAWRPLLESEIKEAQEKYKTATDCAKYLNVSYNTYRKWAMRYGIFKINPWGKGDRKSCWEPNKGKYPLNQILEGKFPDYPVYRLKDLLIRSGTKKAECENCGFSERRITDNKMPLLLNFEDGNEKNHILENIRVFCYNCTFTCGKGHIRAGRVKFNFNDPDIIQGSSRLIKSRF